MKWFSCELVLSFISLFYFNSSNGVHLTKDDITNQHRINLIDCNITSISTNLLEDADLVQTLWIEYNPAFDFQKNKEILDSISLRYFYCKHNMISSIDKETFRHLPVINTIYLDYNNIVEISPDAFKETIDLTYLGLSHNQISSLTLEHPVPNLYELDLNSNYNFNFIPDTPFIEAPELQTLILSSCGITKIYIETFKELENIITMDFSNNQIVWVDANSFEHNRQLINLFLSDNPITSIVFKSESLTLLACENCLISTIDGETLKHLPRLVELNLNNNTIKRINSNTFYNNALLTKIFLDNNRLESIDVNSINVLPELRSLCLDDNKFVPSYTMTKFKNYYESNGLRRNCATTNSSRFFELLVPIINIPDSFILNNSSVFPEWFDASSINVSNTNLTYIDPLLFVNNFNLQTLILNQNHNYKFWNDTPFLFNENLSRLESQYCGIDKIFQNTFAGLPSLMELIISNNHICELPMEVFKNNKKLERLDMSYNNFKKIKYYELDFAENLHEFILDNNKNFDFAPCRVFLYNSNLKYFSCNFCGISQIYKETFEKLANLRTLVLNYNSITVIDKDSFLHNKDLVAVHLDENKLIMFDVSIVLGLTSLVKLCLDNNMNYDFNYSENNGLLKKEYYNRNLRSQECAANTFDQRFENKLKPIIKKSPTISNNETSNNVESMRLLNKNYTPDSNSSIKYNLQLFYLIFIGLILL